MTLQIFAGWDFARIGTFSLVIDDTGTTDTIAFTEGTYAHVDMSTPLSDAGYGADLYTDFATALQTSLNASSNLAGTYTVELTKSTLIYTISCDVNFSIRSSTNTVARQILGLNPLNLPTTAATSYDATRTPYYAIEGAAGCRSSDSGLYEPDDIVDEDETEEGYAVSLGIGTSPKYLDFELMTEERASTFKHEASSSTPWTFQHMFEHCRNVHPFQLEDDSDDMVLFFRDSRAHFQPRRQASDWDAIWNIPFECRHIGYVEGLGLGGGGQGFP